MARTHSTQETAIHAPNIWSGKRKKAEVAKAEALYAADPTTGLIPLVMVLYSFRSNRKFRTRLLQLCTPLRNHATNLLTKSYDRHNAEEGAHTFDAVSTYVEWMSRQSAFSRERHDTDVSLAESLVREGLKLCSNYSQDFHEKHTWFLLRLTNVRLAVRWCKRSRVWHLLNRIQQELPQTEIPDLKQRARIYGKYGLLARRYGDKSSGWNYGVKALSVPEVPRAARIKLVAALLNIDI